jgi:serpin B
VSKDLLKSLLLAIVFFLIVVICAYYAYYNSIVYAICVYALFEGVIFIRKWLLSERAKAFKGHCISFTVKYIRNKNVFKAIMLVIAAFLLYFGYGYISGLAADRIVLTADTNDTKTAVAGNTRFALDLYGRLKDDSIAVTSKGNLFFSPYSISNTFAMVYSGASGQTKEQIATTLHFTLPDQNFYSVSGALQKYLLQINKKSGYHLLIANALWCQKGEPFLKDFLDLTQNYFGSGINQVDFLNESEKSRQKINSWCEEKTKDKIKTFIPPGGINEEAKMVLTDAIYFKGEWKTKFSRWKTKNADFYISSKEIVKVPLMHVKEKFNHCSDANLQALELPYKNDKISMIVILPRNEEGIREVENSISAEYLTYLLSKMSTGEIEVYLPRFKMTGESFCLNKTLSELGISDAFNLGQADFSGINGKRNLCLGNVFHKAYIEVTENGTEVAASTGLTLVMARSPVFRADHPFIFLIKDNHSDSILFIGKVMNPSE